MGVMRAEKRDGFVGWHSYISEHTPTDNKDNIRRSFCGTKFVRQK